MASFNPKFLNIEGIWTMVQAIELPRNKTTAQEVLSELVIPAVPGEYYAYHSEFTEDKPLYVLMKCKANKARSIATARDLGREANLLFLFNSSVQAQVCAIKLAQASGLLGDYVSGDLFGETWDRTCEDHGRGFL